MVADLVKCWSVPAAVRLAVTLPPPDAPAAPPAQDHMLHTFDRERGKPG